MILRVIFFFFFLVSLHHPCFDPTVCDNICESQFREPLLCLDSGSGHSSSRIKNSSIRDRLWSAGCLSFVDCGACVESFLSQLNSFYVTLPSNSSV